MAFKDTYRLEKVYYENIWTLLKLLKNVDKNNVDMGTVKELLDNAIADNESIIIIYKNLGELYAELQNQHMELGKELEKLKDSLEEFKDEINDKIDENHNYIMGLIREIEQRLDDLENRVEDLEERMTQAETDIDSLEGRMTTAEGDIDALETAVDGLEDNLTSLDGRVTTAEGDIDDLEQNKQDKLTAGSGIAIDPDTNEISNTAQGKIYTAGSGIAIDPDTNEISNTAQGATYTGGSQILIKNDEISAISQLFTGSETTVIKSGDIPNNKTKQDKFDSFEENVTLTSYELLDNRTGKTIVVQINADLKTGTQTIFDNAIFNGEAFLLVRFNDSTGTGFKKRLKISKPYIKIGKGDSFVSPETLLIFNPDDYKGVYKYIAMTLYIKGYLYYPTTASNITNIASYKVFEVSNGI